MRIDTIEISGREWQSYLRLRKAAEQASLKLFACKGPREAYLAKKMLDDALEAWASAVDEEEPQS